MELKDRIKIISGGQTGVDRAALDFALSNKIECGGWCPKGRKSEDGNIPAIYPLKETETASYTERTKKNIEESDGTLILFANKLDRGTQLTYELCKSYAKPFLVLKLAEKSDLKKFKDWMVNNRIKTLNIAGPRESNEPGVYQFVLNFLNNLKPSEP